MSIAPGTRLGPYELVSLLGSGGMGQVYRARDPRLGRNVAIKVLPPEFSSDPDRLRRFEREARAVAALNHPHICTIHDIGEHDNQRFLVMELLEGQTLAERLAMGAQSQRAIPVGEALGIAIQITDALDAAHTSGIVHRDLKPANIFVTKRGQTKVLDFGLAKLARHGHAGAPAGATGLPTALDEAHLTSPGMALGTIAYMSPEQARGDETDARTDLFSFGGVLYEMATGRQAFAGRTTAVIFDEILNKAPLAPVRINPGVPPELERIITKALEKDEDLRYQSAADIRADLKRLKRDLESGRLRASSDEAAGVEVSSPAPTQRVSSAESPARPAAAASSRAGFDAAIAPGVARRRGLGLLVASGTVALLLVGVFGWRLWLDSRSTGGAIDSIAVLPFVNASGSPDADYLSDGLADTLTNSLAQIRTLRVVPRTLVAQYKNRTVDPRQAGRDLNVRAIVTGRVVQRGDRLTVQAELIDAVSVAQLWGDQFDRRLADVLTVQAELSRAIADNLRLRLSSEDQQRVAARGTQDTEAYQLYLKGRHEWNTRTRDGMSRATRYFEQALQRDPSYALPNAWLANVYIIQAFYGYLSPHEAYPKAVAAARTAIALDERSADAHATLGWTSLWHEWNWAESQREFQRALALDPDSAIAQAWYGSHLTTRGRGDESVAEFRRALTLDPLSPGIHLGVGYTLTLMRRYDEAVQPLQKALELQPDFAAPHRYLAAIYRQKGMKDLAIAESRRAIELGDPLGQVELAVTYAAFGQRAQAATLLIPLMEESRRSRTGGFDIARVFATLGDKEQAFARLEEAYTQHDQWLIFLAVHPDFDSLRGDARFQALVRRIGIPTQ
jgi:serine/threonine protein kinase/TolB-like protein/tetratricopeptide (TPR) repeat protein